MTVIRMWMSKHESQENNRKIPQNAKKQLITENEKTGNTKIFRGVGRLAPPLVTPLCASNALDSVEIMAPRL